MGNGPSLTSSPKPSPPPTPWWWRAALTSATALVLGVLLWMGLVSEGRAQTPTPTQAAPTCTAAPTEDVPLLPGCNPVTTTYPDAVPIGTIAGAVSPPGILESIWELELGVWVAYSPFFPQATDLAQKDRLDVVFICVGSEGTFARPAV